MPFLNLGGTGWQLGISSYHKIYVLMTKDSDSEGYTYMHRQPSRLLGGGRMTTGIMNMKNNNRDRNLKRKGGERTNLFCKESYILYIV
jgi:hypothetical protein